MLLFIRVQAENKNFSRGTFLNWIDPRIDLTPFFSPPDIVFTYPEGLLPGPSGRPGLNPPVWTILASMSEILLRIGIFGWFSHMLYRIAPRFQKCVRIWDSALQKKVTAVGRYVIFPLFNCAYLGGPFSHCHPKTWLDLVDLAEFLIFFSGKAPDNIAASRLEIRHTYVPL